MSLRLIMCALIALAFAASNGCAHPYSGKAERMKRPRPKKPKDDEEKDDQEEKVVADKDKLDSKCRTNFFDEPTTRRRARDARRLASRANTLLLEAEQASMEERVPIVTDAMNRLINALDKDPYGPLPTYKLAVAYALVNKKGCALALLERLKLLQDYQPVEREARRTVKRALRDLAFDKFRDDARTALGE